MNETGARWTNLTPEQLFAGNHGYPDDDGEDWETVAQPLLDNPTPQLLAVAVVALQRLGVEVGREAIAHGINPNRPLLGGLPFEPSPTSTGLWDWVTRRWTAQRDTEDTDLRPDRALPLNLHGDDGLRVVLELVLHIARITVAARDNDNDTHLYAALHPQLAVDDGGGQGGRGFDASKHHRFPDPNDPWLTLDQAPF